jgi:hypothetical protein
MHLTNYAINKDHENYVANTDKNNDDIGSKRSILHIFSTIRDEILEKNDGKENAEELSIQGIKKLKREIYDMIIKSLCLVTPHVAHLIKTCKSDDLENQSCF